jgi:hypothetical protein
MTTEFRIDRPGVYKRRDGELIYVWPLPLPRRLWAAEDGNLRHSCGRLVPHDESVYDVIEYVRPLPERILRQVHEMLGMAQEPPQ